MGQLSFLDEMNGRPELRLLFRHIDIEGNDILFSVIDHIDRPLTIAYICWNDSERYYGKSTDKQIYDIEHHAYYAIEKILEEHGFEGLQERCKPDKIKNK